MGDLHPLPRWEVTRKRLVGREAQAVMDEDGVLQITIHDELDDKKAAEHVRRILLDPRWRRLSALPVAAVSWLRHGLHGAGRNTTLATGGVLVTGAMLAVVVTASAPLQQQAGGPSITAPQSRPDLNVDPLGLAPPRPLTVQPVRVPAPARGQSARGSQAGVPASLASTLASAGVPYAGRHPLKPARTMVVTSVKNALPTIVPVSSHPVRCVLLVVARHGKPVEVQKCI